MMRRPDLLRSITAPTTYLFEVLVPYSDSRASKEAGVSEDTPQSVIYQVWAADVVKALDYARERFREHRVRHPHARITARGPVPLRVIKRG